jgi:plastocyanin
VRKLSDAKSTARKSASAFIAIIAVLMLSLTANSSFWQWDPIAVHGQTVLVTIFDCSGSNCSPQGGGYGFRSNVLNITTGTTVTWINSGYTTHTSTDTAPAPYWDSGSISPGGSYSKFFGRPGVYHYQCTIHPFMTGIINATGPVVQEPSQQSPNASFPILYLIPIAIIVIVIVGLSLFILRRRTLRKPARPSASP